jgi:CHAD domain-containing protein
MRKRVKWDERRTAIANAHSRLPALAAEYFAEGRKIAAESTGHADLHQFRLRTKRLRYTLEMFRPCYGPGFEQRLERLREIQTLLGELNDCETALQLISGILSASSAQRRKVERALSAQAASHKAGFLAFWRETFDKPGQEQWWIAYLTRGGRNRPVKRSSK